MKTKATIYRAIVESIATYAAVLRIKERLKAMEMDFLRRASIIPRLDHIRNGIIKEKVKVGHKIECLNWFGIAT